MRSVFHRILLLSLLAWPASGGIILFQGTFAADSQVALFNVTADTSETITFQTYSYGGGIVNAINVAAGGFAPTAYLFDNLGGVQTLTNGSCGQVAQDAATGNCDDLFFQDTLGPGTFTLALAVDDNRPVDNFVADGFVQDGNPGFTCAEAGTDGSFCDVTTALGTTRTGDYALAVTGADLVSTPEPGSIFLLLLAGGAMIAGGLRRRSVSRSI